MHSRQLKAFLMVLVMIFSFVFSSNTVLAEGEKVDISATANNDELIRAKEYFDLSITVTNNNEGLIPISNIEVIFGKTSSFIPSGGHVQTIEGTLYHGESVTEDFEMFYSGEKETALMITVRYKYGEQYQKVAKTINIDNVAPDTSSGGDNTGGGDGGGGGLTSEFKPVLEITSAAMPEGKAGGTITIPLTISNIAKYEAREVRITPTLPENVFIIDQLTVYKVVDKIPAGKSADVEFKFKINEKADENIYKIPLQIKYKNIYGNDFTDTKEIYIKITNNNLPARLVVRDAKTNPEVIKPGETFALTFDLWNMGTLEAKNVTVDLNPGNEFFVLNNVTKNYFFEINGLNNKEVTYNLKAKDKLESGTYVVKVLMSHDGETNLEYPLYVKVEGDEKEENVDIVTENVQTPNQAVLAEQPFTVSFDIKNTGTTEAEEIKVTVEAGDKILPQSLNVLTINGLKPGESVPVSFSFISTKDVESKVYPIKAVIEYKKGEEQVKKEQYMGVLIEAEKDKQTLNTVPKIIISEYSSDPAVVKAGENFTLYMTFLNTSKVKAVENMKITLVVNETSEETGGSVFTPVQSSNTFYIDRLEPGETSQKTLVMYTIPDAKAKTYVVTAVFEYEYEENGELKTNKMEDVFGIPVIQPAKLEVTDVIVPDPAYIGEPVYISSEFYNMGRVKLSKLMVRIESEDFDTRESNYFVGNFDIGASDYYEASITLTKPGENRGKVVYTFEDAAGEEHRIEKEFTINAIEAEPVINPFPGDFPGDMGKDPNMSGGKNSFPFVWVAVGGGVLVIGVIVLVIVLRKRKKRKELMLDEDI
ncbi:S-layer protein [Thermoclostridium stercorarium]|uniref:COG1361 S-layer family protein n=1 Tax=Thermoclostridium stercorarium TaxID=1510 RepID=UPI0022495B74|nr:CARDB domain-containing protein [Thermoclostridium stercorarium]UZQ86422.1 S-layer protein [Thermoclostridium stercorarium]